jgi:hypothetical protein
MMTTLKSALRILVTHPYDPDALRIVSHSLAHDIRIARAELKDEQKAEAALKAQTASAA